MSGFMGNYVEVKDRIPEFWEKYPDGCIVNSDPEVVEIDGKTFIKVTTETYRTSSLDERPMTRSSSFEPFPGQTNYTRNSEAENAETSAMGRALGARGIGISSSFASADEVRNRQNDAPSVEIPDGDSVAVTKVKLRDYLAEKIEGDPVEHAKTVWQQAEVKTTKAHIGSEELDWVTPAEFVTLIEVADEYVEVHAAEPVQDTLEKASAAAREAAKAK